MQDILFILAFLGGSIYGRLHDPLVWVMIITIVMLVAAGSPWWHSLIAVVVFWALNIAFVYSWWVEAGISRGPSRMVQLAIPLLIIGAMAHAIGRGLAWAFPRETNKPSV